MVALVAALIAGAGGCGSAFSSGGGDGGTAGTTATGSGASSGGGTAGTGQGGGAQAGGPPVDPPTCFPAGLQDDFETSFIDYGLWDVWNEPGTEISVTNGRLRLHYVPLGVDVTTYGDVYTADVYDLTDCATWIEVPTVLPEATAGSASFLLTASEGNGADITVEEGDIHFSFTVNDVVVKEQSEPYSPTAHRWWRFRNAGPLIYLDTSPDGANWTEGLAHDPPWQVNAAGIGVTMNIWGTTDPAANMAEFDNVNVPPVSP
ncbi:MAG: hypothetical protein JRI23_25835 [Deltaproteobacteria bacterium]|jgi:hypothetical protein|nr:hypothetical protein [Deltaproteobacteria bacterium]MBW2535449.1 hypothetical protein [Deltaproteobacteria bacterium]